MTYSRSAGLLTALRGRRRLLGPALLVVLAAWLAAAFGQCLLGAATVEPVVAAAVSASADSGMSEGMPCPGKPCPSMQSQLPAADADPFPPAGPPLLATGVLLLVGLLVFQPQRFVWPPLPLLSSRSPTLRFYGLRI